MKGKAKIDAEQIENDVREAMMEQKAVPKFKYPVKDTDVVRGNKVTEDNLNTVFYLMMHWLPVD